MLSEAKACPELVEPDLCNLPGEKQERRNEGATGLWVQYLPDVLTEPPALPEYCPAIERT
jgi:hypothetical protein